MLTFDSGFALTELNTLGIPGRAECFCRLTDLDQIPAILEHARQQQLPVRVLGGGSNLILSDTVKALVVKVELMGIEIHRHSQEDVLLTVQAGENWHDFVRYCVGQGYYGLENLALIPGTVGACPVQNIGAYGVEVGSFIDQVNAIDLTTGQLVHFSQADCAFLYRDSYFKQHENRFLITDVRFRLSTRFSPVLSYGPLAALNDQHELSAMDVLNRVVDIRRQKLPDPEVIPNAGSFFKNPIVGAEQVRGLLHQFPEMVHFPYGYDYKLAAGWLIDQAGLKGQFNDDSVGCYEHQALVVVNPRHAGYQSVADWATQVQRSVSDIFGVTLDIEPRHW